MNVVGHPLLNVKLKEVSWINEGKDQCNTEIRQWLRTNSADVRYVTLGTVYAILLLYFKRIL